VGVGWDLEHERAAFRETLVAFGPDAPTACGSWTTTDLAVHVAMGELGSGIPSCPGRFLVGSGVRVDALASSNTSMLGRQRRRHGFDWGIERFARPAPRVHTAGRIGAVSLLEVWAHHEDVRGAHELPDRTDVAGLDHVLAVLVRYHRKELDRHGVRVRSTDRTWFEPSGTAVVDAQGTVDDLCRWLAGRRPLDLDEGSALADLDLHL
jgi:uncharacterized protein (TIGR03083 family)